MNLNPSERPIMCKHTGDVQSDFQPFEKQTNSDHFVCLVETEMRFSPSFLDTESISQGMCFSTQSQ